MEIMLSDEIQAGLDAARLESLRRDARLCLLVEGQSFVVLRMWDMGFAVEAANAPDLRGAADLYEGDVHQFQCLIVAQKETGGEMQYLFRRATRVARCAALDFERTSAAH